MQWFDADQCWPGPYSRNIIVDGWTHVTLKEKYKMKDHGEMGAGIKFYCLVEEPEPWSGDFDNHFSLDGAIIYEIDQYCCTADEVKKAHEEFFREIGCHSFTIRKFIYTKELKAPWDSIKRWAYLKDK